MISLENLREYCRTCLGKLEESSEDGDSKSFSISKFPELEHLIQVCVSKSTVDNGNLCYYAPFVCRPCFDKWFDFEKLYQLAMKSDEKIRKVLKQAALIETNLAEEYVNTKQNKNINEYFIDTEPLDDVYEIEKFETNSPFFTNIHLNNPTINNKIGNNPTVDPTKPNKLERIIINPAKFTTPADDDLDSCYSDNMHDSEFIFKQTKMFKIKNDKSVKTCRKSVCVMKRNYKTRNGRLNAPENYKILNKVNENNTDIYDNETKKVRYRCGQCNKYFWEKTKFEGHMKKVHEGINRPFQCQECNKAYNLYKTLMQHKRECHSEKSPEIYKCEKCDKVFKTGVILKQHLNNKHSENKEALRSICDQCGFIAAHQYSLSRHIINKHTETDQIKCDQCPKVFKTQYSLKYHVLGNHNPSNIKPFKCTECHTGFTRKTLLNQHKRTHLKYTERIKCDFEGCEVRFVKHGDKTHHMRLVHLKVKQHICDFCGEAFGAMQTLRHHRFIHTGEKPYKCNVCGQGFRQRTAMKTHRKTHLVKESEEQDLINHLPETNLSLLNT